MKTVYGIVCDELGLASTHVIEQGRDRPELRFRAWQTPSGEVRPVQAERIPVDRDHDHRWIGEILDLQRVHGKLWAVGHVEDHATPTVDVRVGDETVSVESDLYWSASRWSTEDDEDVVFHSISLTPFPAQTHAQPVRFLSGRLSYRDAPNRWRDQLDRFELELLCRAAVSHLDRGRGEPIVVHEQTSARSERLRSLVGRSVSQLTGEDWQAIEDDYYDEKPPGRIRRAGARGAILAVR